MGPLATPEKFPLFVPFVGYTKRLLFTRRPSLYPEVPPTRETKLSHSAGEVPDEEYPEVVAVDTLEGTRKASSSMFSRVAEEDCAVASRSRA